MAKKALVSSVERAGNNEEGFKVLEVVNVGNEFEIHSDLEWKDCGDTVESYKYWYKSSTNTFKKLPEAVEQSTAGALATDSDGNLTEEYVWNWDTETWSKQSIS
jgi:hypothetical protein